MTPASPARLVHLRPAQTNTRVDRAWTLGSTVAGVALALFAAARATPAGMNDLGLVSVLPWPFWAGAALVIGGFCAAVTAPCVRQVILAGHVIGTIALVTGTPAVTSGLPRLDASYRHLGIIEHIAQTGTVDPSIDAYFNWHGFFSMAALVQDGAGLGNLLLAATWAPMIGSLAYLPPLLLIARGLTTDVRRQWTGVWLFYAANWTAQDYLAPQTWAFWLYLCVIGMLLNGVVDRRTHDRQAVGVFILVAVTCAAIVASHQLTPFALVLALVMLALTIRRMPWELPVLAAVMTGAWLLFPAFGYISGHLDVLLAGVGDAGASAESNVGVRLLSGTAEHRWVVLTRLGEALVIWGAAALGAFHLWRGQQRISQLVALFLAPFPLLALQSYGGEMLIRVYLLGLPFAAHLAAAALLGSWWNRSPRLFLRLSLVGALLIAFTMVARYGNERAESFRYTELQSMRWLYERADAGSVVLSLTQNLPWRFESYATLDHRILSRVEPGVTPPPLTVRSVDEAVRSEPGVDAYVVWTQSQEAMADLYDALPHGAIPLLLEDLIASGRYAVVHETSDALILQRTAPPCRPQRGGAACTRQP